MLEQKQSDIEHCQSRDFSVSVLGFSGPIERDFNKDAWKDILTQLNPALLKSHVKESHDEEGQRLADFPAVFLHISNFDICHEI